MEDNVVQLPDALERRAIRIEAAMKRREQGDQEWIEGTLELAEELAAARDEIPNDIEFNRWLERFRSSAIPRDERAILIKWGQDPVQARRYLEGSKSRSIRMIHRQSQPVQRPRRATPAELTAAGRSPKAELYVDGDGDLVTRIKLLRARVVELETENARLKDDLERIVKGRVVSLQTMALIKKAAAEAKRKGRMAVETVPDEKTKEAYERRIATLNAKVRVRDSKILAFSANGKIVLDKEARKAILICLHPDAVPDAAKRETAFKLFTAAVPEPEF